MDRRNMTEIVKAFVCGGIVAATASHAVTLTEVPRANWTNGVTVPSYTKMYVYVPAKLAAKPPIVVSSHSCGSSASGQAGNMTKFLAIADKNGYVMIFPDNPGQNCWDVGSKQALTHDGGGDPHAVAQMVRYALKQYKGDSTRVYAVGGSSGAMMTQALLGVYPEMFVAGAPRAGVPCGCWAESYASSNQWSGPCATGKVSKTAQDWGDYVRAINPNYKGHRPRVQIFHGDADATIDYNNLKEGVKEWTNVLGLPTAPTTKESIKTAAYSYSRESWKNTCGYTVLEAWTAPGQPHGMTYEEDSIIKFFGLNTVGGQDPELAACGGAGIEAGLATVSPSLAIHGQELVVEGLRGDRAHLTVANTAGQILYVTDRKLSSSTTRIPFAARLAKPGAYILSVVLYDHGRVVDRAILGFVRAL
jgi:acetylxylan esterase